TLETYDPEEDEKFKDSLEKQGTAVAKNYQTDAVVYKVVGEEGAETKLEKVIEDEIRMNHHLKFDGYTLYQAEYQANEFSSMSFKLCDINDEDEEAIDTFTIDITSPEGSYTL